jgi:Glycosyltransferase family 87
MGRAPSSKPLSDRTITGAGTHERPRHGLTPASLGAMLMRPGIAALICFAALAQILGICTELPQRAGRWDFSIIYLSAKVLGEGRNPYTTEFRPLGKKLGLEVAAIHHAGDTPTFLLLTRPLALIPERSAFYLWSALNAVFLGLALVLLLAKFSNLKRKEALILGALALTYSPVLFHFQYGQKNILILLLLVVMIRLLEHRREQAAGLCLALAALLRVFPVLLIGYFAIQRRWRVLGWTLIGLGIGGLTTIWLLGIRNFLSFGAGIGLVTDDYWLHSWFNISLRRDVSRLFWAIFSAKAERNVDLMRRVVVLFASAALLGTTIRATLRSAPGEDPDWRVLSMWIVASVLLSPIAWNHYMVLFFIPFAQLVVAARGSRASTRAQWMAIISYAMVLPGIVLLFPAPVIAAYFGPEWAEWFRSAVLEQWAVSALLAYLATYWFTVDTQWRAGEAACSQAGDRFLGEIASSGH